LAIFHDLLVGIATSSYLRSDFFCDYDIHDGSVSIKPHTRRRSTPQIGHTFAELQVINPGLAKKNTRYKGINKPQGFRI